MRIDAATIHGYLSDRTTHALATLRAQGRVYGPIPYGWRRTWQDALGWHLAPDNDEQRIVAELRRGSWGATYRAMASALNRAHVPTKHGATWYAATVRKILRGPIHAGG